MVALKLLRVVPFVACLLLKFVDVFSTYIMINEIGTVAEFNPLVRFTIQHLGIGLAMALNYTIFTFVIYWIYTRYKAEFLWFTAAATLVVCINNVFQMYKLFS